MSRMVVMEPRLWLWSGEVRVWSRGNKTDIYVSANSKGGKMWRIMEAFEMVCPEVWNWNLKGPCCLLGCNEMQCHASSAIITHKSQVSNHNKNTTSDQQLHWTIYYACSNHPQPSSAIVCAIDRCQSSVSSYRMSPLTLSPPRKPGGKEGRIFILETSLFPQSYPSRHDLIFPGKKRIPRAREKHAFVRARPIEKQRARTYAAIARDETFCCVGVIKQKEKWNICVVGKTSADVCVVSIYK